MFGGISSAPIGRLLSDYTRPDANPMIKRLARASEPKGSPKLAGKAGRLLAMADGSDETAAQYRHMLHHRHMPDYPLAKAQLKRWIEKSSSEAAALRLSAARHIVRIVDGADKAWQAAEWEREINGD